MGDFFIGGNRLQHLMWKTYKFVPDITHTVNF